MAIKIRIAPFSLRTTTGTQDITVSGLGASTGFKGVLFYCSWANTLDSVRQQSRMSVGGSDGTNEFVNNINVEDAQDTTDTERGQWTTKLLNITNETGGVVQASADFNSWITDGVRINVISSSNEAYKGHCILFWDDGDDLQCSVDLVTMNTTATVDVTSVGFEPDIVIGIAMWHFNNARTTEGRFAHGWVHNDGGADPQDQCCIIHDSDHSQATSEATRWFDTDKFIGRNINGGLNFKAAAENFDANGFDINPGGSLGTNVFNIFSLAFNGAIDLWVGSGTGPTSTVVDWEVTSPGFQPQAVIAFQSACTVADSLRGPTLQDEISSCYYAFDEDGNQGCIGVTEDTNLGTSNTCSWASTSNALWVVEDDQSGDFHLASDPAMISTGFEFPAASITTANATARYFGAVAFGAPAAGIQRTAAITAAGTVSAVGVSERLRASSVSGVGTVTAVATREVFRSASISAAGTVTATAQRNVPRAVAIAAVGNVTALAIHEHLRSASISAVGTVTATGLTEGEIQRAVAITSTGTVSATGLHEHVRAASMSAAGTVSATGTTGVPIPVVHDIGYKGGGRIMREGQWPEWWEKWEEPQPTEAPPSPSKSLAELLAETAAELNMPRRRPSIFLRAHGKLIRRRVHSRGSHMAEGVQVFGRRIVERHRTAIGQSRTIRRKRQMGKKQALALLLTFAID